MNAETYVSVGVAVGAAVGSLLSFLGVRSTLKANRPVTTAQADLALASANAQNIETQGNVIERLTVENGRLGARVSKMDEVIAELTRHNDELTRSVRSLTNRMEEIDHALDEAYQQNEQMAAELKEANERAGAAEARAEIAEKQNKLLREQNRILIRHFEAVDEWVRTNYNADHPGGVNPPPRLLPFEPIGDLEAGVTGG